MISSKIPWVQRFSKNVRTDQRIDGSRVCADGSITNWVAGFVQSQYKGLVRAGVRIKIRERMDLRVRWPIEEERYFVAGQHVRAMILAEAARLEAGMFPRSTQRWNRWIGRIVLVESTECGVVYTAKIHGEGWTLMGYGPVIGARQPSKPWDIVNVVVDPQRIALEILD